MVEILQTTYPNSISFIKNHSFWLKFHWKLFPNGQHCFRKWIGTEQTTSHYLNQYWSSLPSHKYITYPRWIKIQCLTHWGLNKKPIFQVPFAERGVCILMQISLKFVPKSGINNCSALVTWFVCVKYPWIFHQSLTDWILRKQKQVIAPSRIFVIMGLQYLCCIFILHLLNSLGHD